MLTYLKFFFFIYGYVLNYVDGIAEKVVLIVAEWSV